MSLIAAGCSMAAKLKGGGSADEPPPLEAAPAADAPPAEVAAPPAAPGDTTGIPEILVKHIRDSYADSPDSQENNFAMVRGAAAAFAPAWKAYQQRKSRVDQVIAKAAALEKAGKLAEAEATLSELLGPVPAGGPQWKQRAFLEPADADFPALEALARVAIARRTPEHTPIPTVLRVAQAMWGRRIIGERDREQLVFMAQCPIGGQCAEHFTTAADRVRWFASSDPELQAAVAAADGAEKQGRKRAMELLASVLSPKGMHPKAPPAQVMQEIIDQSEYERWPQLFDRSAALVASFDKVWQPYAIRKVAVAAAVADAAAMQKAGRLVDARARLEGVITPAQRDAAGQVPARRFIEDRDADLAAVQALAEVLRAGKQHRAFIELGTAFRVRRTLGDADAELARHILRDGALDREPGGFDEGGGDRLAHAHFSRLPDLGIAAGAPEAELVVTRGTPMLLVLPATNWQSNARTLTLSDRAIKFKMTIDGNDKHCRVTNRVDRIEDDGTVRYVEECTYTPKKIHYTAEVSLSEPPPAWAADAGKLHILGTLASNGGPRSWKLKDAVILDLRYQP